MLEASDFSFKPQDQVRPRLPSYRPAVAEALILAARDAALERLFGTCERVGSVPGDPGSRILSVTTTILAVIP